MGDAGRRIRHELGYRALRGMLATARPIPLPALRRIGIAIGRLAMALSRRERGRAAEHLALAFPELDDSARAALLVATGRHLGRLLGEIAWLWSVPAAELLARTEIVGLENLAGALSPKRGAVLITGHCGNWEWMNLALGAAGVPMTVAAREVYDPRLDAIAVRLRGRFGGETELRGTEAGRGLLAALRHGRVAGLLIDQDIDTPGAFVEFFGRPAWTPVGAAVLALRAGVPVVPGFASRLQDGRVRVTCETPIDLGARREPEVAAALTALLTARIEAQVRTYPEQWVWMHRRWRRQPGPNDRVWTAADAAAL